jgi:capsular exopolysaccharide synthesis family protein
MQSDIDLRSILGLIRRQIWVIVSVVIALVVLTAAITFTLTPKYTATAKVFVDTSSKDLLNPTDRVMASNAENARVESEVEILDSESVKIQVIQDEKLVSDEEFGVKLGLTDSLLSRLNLRNPRQVTVNEALAVVLRTLSGSVAVRREGLTYIISASVTSKDPEKAARLANGLVTAYVQQQLKSKVSQVVAGLQSLQDRAKSANEALAATDRQFNDFIDSNLDRIERESGSAEISQLRQELEQVRRERSNSAMKIDQAEASLASGNLSQLVSVLQNDAVSEMERQRSELEKQISEAPQGSASAVDLRAELSRIEESLRQNADQELATLKQAVAIADKSESETRDKLLDSMLKTNLPPDVVTSLFSLRETSRIRREQTQKMLQRIEDLEAQAALQVADSRVVSPALVPAYASFPNTRLILALAFVLALGLGLGLAILREHFIGGVVSDEQVESALRIPLASVMPRQQSMADATHSIADLVISSPLSMFSEGVRRIRVKIEQVLFKRSGGRPLDSRDGIVILVSSTEPNEGKSTVSLALARTLASSGKRAVLIDCDLRKPSIHKLLDLPPSTELIDLLKGNEMPQMFTSITTTDPMSSLTVILGGRSGDHATDDLLMGDRIARLLAAAKKHFDYVVIDTPPVDPVVDSLYLARHADVIAFVIRWASTSQTLARKSVAALIENARPETPVIGVLNQKEQTKIAGYYKYSGYYTK